MPDNASEQALLSGNMESMTPDKAVKMVRELCRQLGEDADSFHGNIWPGNIRFDWDGRAILGSPDRESPAKRLPEQVEYMAPEYFWDGNGSAASDIYSLALLLFCVQAKGKLPFQAEDTEADRAAALRRRMKGELISLPSDISPLLGSIVEKALSFDPEQRYISPAALLAALNETDEALPAPPPEEHSVYAAIAADTEPVDEAALISEEPAADDTAEEPAADDTAEEPAADDTAEEPAAEEAVPVSEASAVPEEAPEPEAAAVPEPADTAPLPEAPLPADEIPEEPLPEPAETEAPPHRSPEEPPLPKYLVEKDFEKPRRSKSDRLPATVKKSRSKSSPVIPLLCVLALLIIAAVIYFCFFSDTAASGDDAKETLSEPYVIEITPEPTAAPAAEAVTEEPADEAELAATEEPSAEPEATAVPEETAEPEATPAPENNLLTIVAEANVRSGPGTGYDVIEIAPVGKTYSLLGRSDAWYKVDTDGVTGYIHGNLVSVKAAAKPDNAVTLTVVSDVNIRAEAGTGSAILGVADAGSELTAIGPAENGWYPISYGESGLYAYVAEALVAVK